MARKLTPKELKAARGSDFDLPTKPPDPGQTELFTEKRKGRPKKHDQAGRSVSFWLTERAIRKLRASAAMRGMSAADLLHEMIANL